MLDMAMLDIHMLLHILLHMLHMLTTVPMLLIHTMVMLLSITPRIYMVKPLMDSLHHTKLNMRSEIMLVMLLDHTHTLMLKERSSKLPTLLELMDSRSTPTIYQLLQLLILLSQLLQSTQELHLSQSW